MVSQVGPDGKTLRKGLITITGPSAGGLRVDRQGNVYVGVAVKPKGRPVPGGPGNVVNERPKMKIVVLHDAPGQASDPDRLDNLIQADQVSRGLEDLGHRVETTPWQGSSATLSRLLDLCRQAEAPVHYTDVARALEVSPVTAYEMLRLLEDKRLVRSETSRPEGHRGRSVVVFSPTERARAMFAELTGNPASQREWEEARAAILAALERGRGTDYQDLLNELLLRIPERKSPLLFTADMITAIILVFYELRDTAAAKS